MISAVVITKNEEKNIEDCLAGLKWCDEIIVVDDNSEDNTQELAKNAGAKVFTRAVDGDFASQRNFGLEKAAGDWVFFVDADERVEKTLADEVGKATGEPGFTGYFVKRKDFMFGRWLKYGEVGNVCLLRLARKGSGKWVRPIHETWDIIEKTGQLRNPLLHYPHPTVAEFLHKINFYTTLNANVFFKNGERAGIFEIVAYPSGKFITNYFLKAGFLDGTAGLMMALMMSFHSFLTRGKIWQLGRSQS